MVSQLGKGFRLGNAYTDSQVRALQDRRSYLAPEICQIPAVSYSRQITKSLINAVNFYPRAISSSVVITRFDISA